jgi:predicted transcriptional regulator
VVVNKALHRKNERRRRLLLFLAKIDRGLQQADAGQTIPHAQVREKMAKWLK